jgi:RNA polymerase sigma factor (sigma-70 family)
MWHLSDEALLAGMASGDGESAATLVRRLQARVFGLTLSVLGDRKLAEDAAQETFLKVWRHGGSFDGRRGRASSWVLSIAKNVAIDQLRMRRPEPVDPMETLSYLADESRGPEEAAVVDDSLQRLRSCISELPIDQRRCLALAVYHGRTAREIGEIEGIPVGTAKTRIRSGMVKLRQAMVVPDE